MHQQNLAATEWTGDNLSTLTVMNMARQRTQDLFTPGTSVKALGLGRVLKWIRFETQYLVKISHRLQFILLFVRRSTRRVRLFLPLIASSRQPAVAQY